jgi:hypothetical protein
VLEPLNSFHPIKLLSFLSLFIMLLCQLVYGVFGTARLEGLFQNHGSSKTAPNPLLFTEKWLLKKMFCRAPPEEPKLKLRRSPAKQALNKKTHKKTH